jgi:FkbM family methyltransferase
MNVAQVMISRINCAVRRRVTSVAKRVTNMGRIRACNVRGQVIFLDVESEIEEFRANTYETKEPETLEWIERYFRPGDVMYDVGANIGLYSLFAAGHLGGRGKVFAFEPEALNYAKLSKNIHLNGLSGAVLPCCFALTDRLCFDTFNLHPDNFETIGAGQDLSAGSAMHRFGVAVDFSGKGFRPFHVQGTLGAPLDELWRTWGMEFPNHLKIDVDGLEDKVIGGAARTLQDNRLRSILIEVSGKLGDEDPIFRQIIQAGFTRVTDFAAHSGDLLKGTLYEDSVNSVFVRGV